MSSVWFVYMIKTRLNTLYTGVTIDVERRLAEHASGSVKGARYLRGKGPLTMVWHKQVADKRQAMQVEYRLKRLPRATKDKIVAQRASLETIFPELFNNQCEIEETR